MTITVKKISITEQPAVVEDKLVITENYLGLIGDVEVACLVRLGSLTMTVAELRQLKQGQILSLNQKTHEPIDVVLNNQIIARGDLMSSDEHFAIQITEVCA